jgi:hypothetical protein
MKAKLAIVSNKTTGGNFKLSTVFKYKKAKTSFK